MTGPDKIGKVDRLRARDGNCCWLCNKPMDFDAIPNTAHAWSIEHLVPLSRGGPDTLENLALCHPGCNRILKDRPLADKIRLRERRRRKLWIATLGSR
jgi:5-methylcytosine-specific restriction endonuclease McrA